MLSFNQELWNSLLEHTTDFIILSDLDLNIVYINKAIQDLTLEQVVGSSVLDFIFPDYHNQALQCIDKAVRSGQPSWFEMEASSDAKTATWYMARVGPVFVGGNLRYISLVSTDITEQKLIRIENEKQKIKLERRTQELEIKTQELEARTQDLERSNAELESFAYVASHDLQEPLRTMSSFIEIIREDFSELMTDEAEEYFEYIVDASARMKSLILGLLEYSRISSKDADFEITDLNVEVDKVVRDLNGHASYISIEKLPIILADKTQIRRMFQNLIGNALKFSREGIDPLVEIFLFGEDADSYILGVRDNGVGIEEEYLEKIFIIFKRLYTQDKYTGTGIGLAVTKKIVERHGGTIWVDSVFGEGSTFYFTLPKA